MTRASSQVPRPERAACLSLLLAAVVTIGCRSPHPSVPVAPPAPVVTRLPADSPAVVDAGGESADARDAVPPQGDSFAHFALEPGAGPERTSRDIVQRLSVDSFAADVPYRIQWYLPQPPPLPRRPNPAGGRTPPDPVLVADIPQEDRFGPLTPRLQRLAEMFLVPEIQPHEADWCECQHRYGYGFVRALRLADGSEVSMEGWFWVDFLACGVTARVGSGGDATRLAAALPSALFRRPPGYGDAVVVQRHMERTETLWTTARGDAPPAALDTRCAQDWPYSIRSWSDGTWVVTALGGVGGSRGHRPALMKPPAGFLNDALAPENEWQRYLDPPIQRLSGKLYPPLAASPGTASDARFHHARDDCVYSRLAEAKREVYRGVGFEPFPRDWWQEGQVATVPPLLARYANVDPATQCLTRKVTGYPLVGDGLAGLLEGYDSCLEPIWSATVQWVLGERKLAITAVRRDVAIPDSNPSTVAGDGMGHGALANFLPFLLGPHGRSLTLVPVREEASPVRGVLVRPEPEVMVGPLADRRLGDVPWGRCTMYSDGTVVHVVFDLLPEDVAVR